MGSITATAATGEQVQITEADVDLCRYLATRTLHRDSTRDDYLRGIADACTTPLARAAAWLHDAPARGLGSEQMRDEGVPEPVVRVVGLLNRKRTTSELVFYADVAGDPVALEVEAAVLDEGERRAQAIVDDDARRHVERAYARARALLGLPPLAP